MVSSLSLFLGTVAEALKGPLEVLKRTPFGRKSYLKFTFIEKPSQELSRSLFSHSAIHLGD